MTIMPQGAGSPFDQIKRTNETGDYWTGRELQPLMGYRRWEDFAKVVRRAEASAMNTGQGGFSAITEKLPDGGRPREDFRLTRFAAYLVAMNGDPNMREVAAAQAYFAVRTRQAETALPDLTSLEGISAILDAGKAALNRAQEAERRALALEGPAAERDLYRSSAGLQLIGDVANRFKTYASDRWPDIKVKHQDVWDHAGRLGIVIRGNTVRHNQPTAAAIENGWARPAETLVETKNHGTRREVHTRLTTKGETRLWDGLVAYVTQHDTLTITKEIAA